MKKPVGTIQDKNAIHPLQSWAWGEFRRAMGVDVVRINDWQITFHNVPFTPFCIGYFPKGPMPTRHMIEVLHNIGLEKHAIFIQLEPNVIEHEHVHLKELGLRPSHHPLFTQYTFILDLTKSEEELLKAMHPKTRYNIRLAQKHGVSVTEDNSKEAFDAYLSLTQQTTERQRFYAHTKTYHTRMWDTMREAGIANLWTARYNDEILAAWIVFVWKDTIYYPYGSSSRNHRDVMAPNLLLWEIARWAKKQGVKKFDLWGALGPTPDPSDPWFGFHRFKEGYHPDLVKFIGSYDLVINPLLYNTLYSIADTIRWMLLRARR